MRNRVPDEATCAICGRHFDPSETRGWCPNPSCGEWQHPSFPIDESGGSDTDDGAATGAGDAGGSAESPAGPTRPCPNCGNDVRADANFCKYCATQLTDEEPHEPAEEPDEEGVIDECPDCGADLSGIPSDRLSTCPICMFDLTPVLDGAEVDDATARTDVDRDELTECPNCGEDLTPIPSEMRTVCPGCRVDLEEGLDGEPEAEKSPPGTAERTPPTRESRNPTQGDQHAPAQQSSEPTESQAAGDAPSSDPGSMPLDQLAGIAGGYVQRLSEIGITTVGDLAASDPDTVSAKTGISARRIRDWIADAPVDVDDGGAAQGLSGSSPDAGRQAASPDPEPDPDPEPTASTEPDSDPEPAPTTESQSRSGGAGGATDSGVDHQETRIQRAPQDLVLDVMGKVIEVTDGETVGREVRNAMVAAGAPEEDAVYVHRKHIRIDVDDEGFVLTRLGENSLTLNGRTVEKGDQVRIEDGDEIGFSDVVTATVSVR